MIRGYFIAGRTIALVVGLVVLAVICFSIPTCISKWRSQGAQGRLERGQAGAFTNSAADAVNTQGAANAREADSEALTRSNEGIIRNAQGSTDPVNPAVRDAGLDSLCRRPSYRDSKRCRMRRAPAQ